MHGLSLGSRLQWNCQKKPGTGSGWISDRKGEKHMAKETGKETANSARDREMALFKFSLIAPVVAGTFTQTTKMDYYKETCSREHLLPGGKAVKLSPLTLKKWYWLYTSGGLEALLPKTRSDLGESRVLSVDACRQIEAYRKELEDMG